jgi:hypothetical protein
MADDTAVDAPGARGVGCSWKVRPARPGAPSFARSHVTRRYGTRRRLGRREHAFTSARVPDFSRPSPLLASQCLADADAVRAVTGPRVQLLCVDASPRLVVFGSSIGSVYVFERRTSDGDAFDDDDADATSATRVSDHFKSSPLPEEGELRFLERFMVETHAGGSASRPVTRLRVNERRTRCALAFDDGEVVVVAFADPLKSLQTATSSDDTPSSGRYEAGIPKGHKGANVTSMAWSPSGDALISGDDAGAVSVVYLEGKSAGAHVVRFDAPVVQTSFLDVDGGAALVSTTTQLCLLHRANGFKKTPIGAKPRDGAFGASAHGWTRAAVPEETLAQLDAEEAEKKPKPSSDENETETKTKEKRAAGESAKSVYWMFGARPGRRLWVCRAATEGELSEAKVLATVRPSVPEASASPGSASSARLASRLADKKKFPKKWEFGALHALGPCVLSSSEKAIAVVDVVSAAVLAWYPLAPSPFSSGGSESEENKHEKGMRAPRDLATRGARAFALGADGDVWCLCAPANAAQLAAASAALAREAREARSGIEAETGESETKMDDDETSSSDPAAHLKRIERRVRSVAAPAAAAAAEDENASDEPRAAFGFVASAFFFGAAERAEFESSKRRFRLRGFRVRDDHADVAVDGDRVHHARAQRARRAPRRKRRLRRLRRLRRSRRGDSAGDSASGGRAGRAADVSVPGDGGRRGHRRGDRDDAAPGGTSRRGDPKTRRRRRRRDSSESLRDADRDLVLEETSAPSSSEVMVESEDTPTSSETASPVSENRDTPPRVRTRSAKDAKNNAEKASPTSPTSASESEISAPDSPQATETNQLFPADMNPWWMRLIGCGGCGPVRSNKQEKSGLGMNW